MLRASSLGLHPALPTIRHTLLCAQFHGAGTILLRSRMALQTPQRDQPSSSARLKEGLEGTQRAEREEASSSNGTPFLDGIVKSHGLKEAIPQKKATPGFPDRTTVNENPSNLGYLPVHLSDQAIPKHEIFHLPSAAIMPAMLARRKNRPFHQTDKAPIGNNYSGTESGDPLRREKSAKQDTIPPARGKLYKRLPVHVEPSYQEDVPYPAGRPWRTNPIKPIRVLAEHSHGVSTPQTSPEVGDGSLKSGSVATSPETLPYHPDVLVHREDLRRELLRTLALTPSAAEAWEAFSILSTSPPSKGLMPGEPDIPFAQLHRLCRVLARNRPKTRTQFLRLLSVLSMIHNAGGQIYLHEWNALIDNAGKGWRKTRPEDFKLAMCCFNDMINGRAPGTTVSENELPEEGEILLNEPVKPDIYTYTTLINLAACTLDTLLVRRALSLLEASGLPPNRITHLSLLIYFAFTDQMASVRSTVLKMEQQGFQLGIDGINACLWTYGHNERVDVVMMIYRLLRHNRNPELETEGEEDTVTSVARQLRREEHIVVPSDIRPNEITYTIMIQTMAYHGNLLATLTVFMDMIGSENLERGGPLHRDESGEFMPLAYSPTIAVYRAIFLGFTRHGVPPDSKRSRRALARLQHAPDTGGRLPWSLEKLRPLFDTFLTLPDDVKPGRSTIYWIITAFDRTSGSDRELLREVWTKLEKKHKGPWGGPGNRLSRWRSKLFPEEGEEGVDRPRLP